MFSLRNALSIKRNDLFSRFQVIETKARQLLEYSQGGTHLTFTPHGLSHITAVEKNIDWLLSADDIASLNDYELFCLLCATLFHDALMIPVRLGDEQEARKEHATRAKEFLTKQGISIGITIHEANAVSQIILGHAVNNLQEIQKEMVIESDLIDIRKLGAILSVADICHADSTRAPEIVLQHLELDEESLLHWRRHLQISGITRSTDHLIMSAVYFSEEGYRAVLEYKEQIERQLNIVRPYFHSILTPITGVDLQAQQLQSPFEVPLNFQTNTSAIVDMLIDGIYQRSDVFLREIVQNSLDACHLRFARAMQRTEKFEPKIVISFLQQDEKLKAIRIDDNGVGLDLGDVQDTLLWIGNSIADKEDVRDLLSKTTGKKLIATFGVGLLSCFKVAKKIVIRSAKEKRDPVQFAFANINDQIKLELSEDKSIGTTLILELKEEYATAMDVLDSLEYYFRYIQFAPLLFLVLEWGESIVNLGREEVYRTAITEAEPFVMAEPYPENCVLLREIKADDYSAWLWLPQINLTSGDANGEITILNDGIFVSVEHSKDWLPKAPSIFHGTINFSPGAIDLPVSRDKVVQNDKFVNKRNDMSARSAALFEKMVEYTKAEKNKSTDAGALLLTHVYNRASNQEKEKIVRGLEGYYVKLFQDTGRNITLGDISGKQPAAVYLIYPEGRFVSTFTTFEGRQLYHHRDDIAHLQAALLVQGGEFVISTSRQDLDNDYKVLESDLIEAFFSKRKISVIDLTITTDAISEKIKILSLPEANKNELSKDVIFVKLDNLPNRRGWRIGQKILLNTMHPQIEGIYRLLTSTQLELSKIKLANILANMIAGRFDEAVNELNRLILADE